MTKKIIKSDIEQYIDLKSPNRKIFKNTLLLSLPLLFFCFILFLLIPSYSNSFYSLFKNFFYSFESYSNWINDNLSLSTNILFNRIIFLVYIALYLSMWIVYFKSKKSDDPAVEAKRYKVMTLRRLLGMTSHHWSSAINNSENNSIENYKKKAEISMIVIALFIAISILIFDQISNVLLSNPQTDFWNKSKLWLAMLCVIVSFICLMICVDSLDTLYNNFKNNEIRDLLMSYFQNFTLNPRYIATSAMFFAMILLISFHSEFLASIAIGVLFYVGYSFWFPKLSKNNQLAPYRGLSPSIVALLFSIPLLAHFISLLYA